MAFGRYVTAICFGLWCIDEHLAGVGAVTKVRGDSIPGLLIDSAPQSEAVVSLVARVRAEGVHVREIVASETCDPRQNLASSTCMEVTVVGDAAPVNYPVLFTMDHQHMPLHEVALRRDIVAVASRTDEKAK